MMADEGIETEVDADQQLEAEADSEADPMDPKLGDVDKIIKRYESEDADKELKDKKTRVGDDATGGIDKISAASLAHSSDDDNAYLKKVFDYYSTAGKTDGTADPEAERYLSRWNTQLASEDIIKKWVNISEPALEKFIGDNF
jgi:hypothetical protein